MVHTMWTRYRFNVGLASQPLAGSMPDNHIRRWPNIETELGYCPVLALTYVCTDALTLYPPKGHHPDNTIHWPNCAIMLVHRLRRWANVIPTKPLQALNHEYNHEYLFFSEDFLNTKVLNLGTGVQKCEPLSTHSNPPPPPFPLNRRQTQNKAG